jgi:Mg-chelatase subunit ChlD
MNPENPTDPRQALEPSLTALLLGELPDDQARFVRQAIATDPELAKTFERLKQTTALIRETEARPIEEPAAPRVMPKLSEARRQELLNCFKTVQPEQFKNRARTNNSWLLPVAAAAVLTLVLASALLPALSRSKARSMAELNTTERLLQRKMTITPLPGSSSTPESAAVKLSETLPPSQRQEYDRESLYRNKVITASGDEKAPSPNAGKPLDSLNRVQEGRAPAQNDSLAVQYTALPGTAGTPEAPSSAPVQQTIVLPAAEISQPWSVSAGNRELAGRNWGLDIQSPPTSTDLGHLPKLEQARRDTTFTYGADAFGGLSLVAPLQQAPALGDEAQLGRGFSTGAKDINGLAVAQTDQSAQARSDKEDSSLTRRPDQRESGLYFNSGGIGGNLTTLKSAQNTQHDTPGQLANSQQSQSVASADKLGVEFDTFQQAKSPPALQSEFRLEDKLAESELHRKLALDDSRLSMEKASEEVKKNELASTANGPQVLLKKQAAEPSQTISVKGVGGVVGLETFSADGRQLASLAEGRVDQQDLGAAKPALQVSVPQPEVHTRENAFSTFSLNVSDVSFKLAAASLEQGKLPDAAGIRSEEFINAFDYRDPEPAGGQPVAFSWDRARYPFAQNRDLLRFSIKTAAAGRQAGKPLNVVLLLDNSGSMERADRVRIIHEALRVLAGQLQASDTLSVVTFARTARLWVDGVPGDQAGRVADQLSALTPQGGTNLEEAMNLAYQTALRHYLANGINRVVLLTDGAANLGDTDPEVLKRKVEVNRKQGIALDCFGIGWEGYNDDLLEVLTRNGDGRYGFLNTPEEAATEFAGHLAGALQPAASDVKVQVEFNPNRVTSYRQIGYARHQLTKEQFRDNAVNAAAIGAAESGNALYVIETNPQGDGPIATVRVRYRLPGTADYQEHEWAVPFSGNAVSFEQASPAMRLAGSAAAFSEWLGSSPYAAEITPDRLIMYLSGVSTVYGADPGPQKLEWMVRQAKAITGK